KYFGDHLLLSDSADSAPDESRRQRHDQRRAHRPNRPSILPLVLDRCLCSSSSPTFGSLQVLLIAAFGCCSAVEFFFRLQVASQGHPRSEQPRTHSVHRDPEQLRNFRITQLFIFTQHEDFAFRDVEPIQTLANPQCAVGCLLCCGLRTGEYGSIMCDLLAPFGGQQFQRDTVQIRSEQSAWLVTRGRAYHCQESFL